MKKVPLYLFLAFCCCFPTDIARAETAVEVLRQDIKNSYFLIKRETSREFRFDDSSAEWAKDDQLAGLSFPLGSCNSSYTKETLSYDKAVRSLAELAYQVNFMKSALHSFDQSKWREGLIEFEEEALLVIQRSREPDFDALRRKYASNLNGRNIRQLGLTWRFQGDPDGCGDGDRPFILSSSPRGAKISVMNRIWANFCQEKNIDYRSNDCDFWFSIGSGDQIEYFMSGRYKVRVSWPSGRTVFQNFDADSKPESNDGRVYHTF